MIFHATFAFRCGKLRGMPAKSFVPTHEGMKAPKLIEKDKGKVEYQVSEIAKLPAERANLAFADVNK
jgi:hypothetical protein